MPTIDPYAKSAKAQSQDALVHAVALRRSLHLHEALVDQRCHHALEVKPNHEAYYATIPANCPRFS